MREGERDITARSADESESDSENAASRRAAPAGGSEPVAAVAAVNRAGALNPRRPRRLQSRYTRPSSARIPFRNGPIDSLNYANDESSLHVRALHLRENIASV